MPELRSLGQRPENENLPEVWSWIQRKETRSAAPKAAPATVASAKPTKNGGTVTLEKPQVNKAQAVRDYLNAHPGAGPVEIVAALAKQGIKMTRSHVSNIKTKINKEATTKKPAAAVAAAPAVVETPKTNGGTITLEQVKKVAHTIKTLGGYQRVTEVLEVIKELGGVKKFKDLAEAMTVPSTDDIPF